MGILLAFGSVVSFLLWNFFGYRWDWPLYMLRKSSFTAVYLGILVTSFFIGVYTFAPEKTTAEISRFTHEWVTLPLWVLKLIAIVLTLTTNFAYHYKKNTTTQCTKLSAITLFVTTGSATYFIYEAFSYGCNLSNWVSIPLSIWFGLMSTMVFHIESKLFLHDTQNVPI